MSSDMECEPLSRRTTARHRPLQPLRDLLHVREVRLQRFYDRLRRYAAAFHRVCKITISVCPRSAFVYVCVRVETRAERQQTDCIVVPISKNPPTRAKGIPMAALL